MRSLFQISFASAIILCCPIATVFSVDHVGFSDLRVEGTILPDTFDVDATGTGPLGTISQSGDTEFADAWRIGIVGHGARFNNNRGVAFGSGCGIHYSRWHDGDNVNQTIEALAATIRLGIVFQPTALFHLEAMPYGSLGAARGKIDSNKSDPELYWEFGGIAGAYLTLSNIQFGVHGGYLWNGSKLKFNNDTVFNNVTAEIRGEGAFLGVSVGARF